MDVTLKYGCFAHVAVYLVFAEEQVVSGKSIFFILFIFSLAFDLC